MALTKVRLPVADIAAISDGTSDVTINGAGGDIDMVVAGVTIGTFDAVGLDLGTLRLTAQDITTEDVRLTNGVVAARLDSDGTELNLETTSAHPVVIGANSVDALIVETDGQVELQVEGTAAGHLVTKAYVDALAGISTSDVVANTSVTGSIVIPNSTGNDLIINWGRTASLANDANEVVVFDTPFPNAFLSAFTAPHTGLGSNGTFVVDGESTTGMTVYNTANTTCDGFWMAIGY